MGRHGRPGRDLTADRLRDWLEQRLSPAERPRDITVVTELRRNAAGKPIRGADD
jgi:acyl-CoA synthetase (AMP-forming)/AMP-acid ligase II